MENDELTLDYVITKGKFKGKTIAEVIDINRHEIFNMIKKGFYFDDEVLKAAHITRHIRDSKIIQTIIDRKVVKDTKVYPKETKKVSEIIDSMNYANDDYDDFDDVEEEIDDNEE